MELVTDELLELEETTTTSELEDDITDELSTEELLLMLEEGIIEEIAEDEVLDDELVITELITLAAMLLEELLVEVFLFSLPPQPVTSAVKIMAIERCFNMLIPYGYLLEFA